MTAYDDLAARYIAVWNETDSDLRTKAVEDLFAENISYVDPMCEAAGRETLAATIGVVQGQFPGFAFTLHGAVDGHHNQVRFQWALGPEGVEAPIIGFDVAEIDENGQIHTVLGFLDKVPAGA